jgi:hypothetical protein
LLRNNLISGHVSSVKKDQNFDPISEKREKKQPTVTIQDNVWMNKTVVNICESSGDNRDEFCCQQN